MVMKTDNNFEEDNSIIIRGARQHNLKNINLLYLGINLLFLQESVEAVKVL